MIIPVVWLSLKEGTPNRGYWDQGILEHIFDKKIWNPVGDYEFKHYDNHFLVPLLTGYIVVIPARYHADEVERINNQIAELPWVIVILTGDEEAVFPVEQLSHPRMKIYVMTPNFDKHKGVDRFLGDGWPPDAPELIGKHDGKKTIDWSFAGQVTHSRRQEAAKSMKSMLKDDRYQGSLVESKRFTEGLPRDEYYEVMAASKVVVCPSGPETPDTFRFYEALEAGCLPIVDDKTPKDTERTHYWHNLFGDVPFPIISDWRKLKGLAVNHLDRYPNVNNRAFSWWQQKKRELVYNLLDDIAYLSENKPSLVSIKDKITVLMPVSPVPSHPDTEIVEYTLNSVRDKLPDSEIFILIDGVREEQNERYADYQEFIRRVLWKCNFEWKNVLPIMFDEHKHQSGMTREALKYVRTPTILFVEQDTPICESIPWESMVKTVVQGEADMIRLHHEALILHAHKHLMLDNEPIIINETPFVRTGQWSQRPHLAATEFYKRILNDYFSEDSKAFIEDVMHSKAITAFQERGKAGWNDFKIMIYAPAGDMKRSVHTDGRKEDPKYENVN